MMRYSNTTKMVISITIYEARKLSAIEVDLVHLFLGLIKVVNLSSDEIVGMEISEKIYKNRKEEISFLNNILMEHLPIIDFEDKYKIFLFKNIITNAELKPYISQSCQVALDNAYKWSELNNQESINLLSLLISILESGNFLIDEFLTEFVESKESIIRSAKEASKHFRKSDENTNINPFAYKHEWKWIPIDRHK